MKRLLLSWSSGKDSAWALHLLRQQAQYEIAGLLTTFNQEFDRVAMHGVRRVLVEQQASAAGLPLWTVPLPWPCSNEQYEALMSQACREAIARGIECVAFGDLFLEDVRAYRERQLSGTGLEPVFPAVETSHARTGARNDSGGSAGDSDLRGSQQARREFRRPALRREISG